MQKVGNLLKADVSGVPFTVIGDHYIIGWQGEPSTGRAIEAAVREARGRAAPDVVAGILPRRPTPPTAP